MSTSLERPSARWRDSYLNLVGEFRDRGEPLVPFPLGFATDDFPAFLAKMDACSRGEDLPDGFVPHTTYWLVEDDREVVAVANLRHVLNERLLIEGGHIGYGVRPSARRRGHATTLLGATLREAVRHGITRCLVTCSRDNIASARTIRHHGGVLENELPSATHGGFVQRYWIELAPTA